MTSVSRFLADEDATAELAAELSLVARRGDVIWLEGDLGAGKSSFARAFIRALAGGAMIEVPSPTFTLLQLYPDLRLPVAHADLYRLSGSAECEELGLAELARDHVVIVEWPDRLEGDSLSRETLRVRLEHRGTSRQAVLMGDGSWPQRLAKLTAIADFLKAAGWTDATRQFLEGDASSRRYERLARGAQKAVLMDMPERDDKALLANGRTYSDTAHLANSVVAAAAVNRALSERGFSAPNVIASDLRKGFLITADFGNRVYGRMMKAGEDMREPLAEAVACLARLAGERWPPKLAAGEGVTHPLRFYDAEAYGVELDLFLDWFLPAAALSPAPEARDEFNAIWHELLGPILPQREVLVLRDFHSPNLLWLPEREGIARVGLIDTQDAVLGPAAYDLASLLQDARVAIAPEIAAGLLDHYCGLRGPGWDEAQFRREVTVLSTQRLLKVLGIFVRLSRRDGKHGYLPLIPQLLVYLEANLREPVLEKFAAWRRRHLPEMIHV